MDTLEIFIRFGGMTDVKKEACTIDTVPDIILQKEKTQPSFKHAIINICHVQMSSPRITANS